MVRFLDPKKSRTTTKDEDEWSGIFLPSSTEVGLSSRSEGASTLSPSANAIFAPIPGSGGDLNYFHAISFKIVTQSHLKIGRCDRQDQESGVAGVQELQNGMRGKKTVHTINQESGVAGVQELQNGEARKKDRAIRKEPNSCFNAAGGAGTPPPPWRRGVTE
jgi:hypothetical protein